MTNRQLFREGLIDALPIWLSFFFMFSSLGSICQANHLNDINSLLLTLLIFAAPAQLAILYALKQDVNILYIIFIVFVVNFRFLLNSAVMAPYFRNAKPIHSFIAMLMFSASTFTVAYTKFKSEDFKQGHIAYFYGVAIPSYIFALVSTMFGYYFVKEFSDERIPLIFMIVMPLHFAALTARRYPDIFAIVATLSGFLAMPFIQSLKINFIEIIYALIIGVLFCVLDARKKGKSNA
ncbi:AzlC family ABC transporter permease [Fluviispira multicolorata]|uniref:AzlC family ABC transporter permease n=1 Tax=Fluviispira multicolorata TaxID=2654512 RepID=UPI0013757D3D|nr:AzlC family ABC transporter permease [Fluviispira multicolorata]